MGKYLVLFIPSTGLFTSGLFTDPPPSGAKVEQLPHDDLIVSEQSILFLYDT